MQKIVQASGEGHMQVVLVDVQRNGVGGNQKRKEHRLREVSERGQE